MTAEEKKNKPKAKNVSWAQLKQSTGFLNCLTVKLNRYICLSIKIEWKTNDICAILTTIQCVAMRNTFTYKKTGQSIGIVYFLF